MFNHNNLCLSAETVMPHPSLCLLCPVFRLIETNVRTGCVPMSNYRLCIDYLVIMDLILGFQKIQLKNTSIVAVKHLI